MLPEPTYPDFYVAVLTIVPIVLVGQFVVWRQFQGSSPRLRRRLVVFLGHAIAGCLALGSIIVALAVLGGFSEDEVYRRLWLLGMTVVQAFLGVLGLIGEAFFKHRPPGSPL